MADFLARLRQRKIVQWAVAWVAFAFALLQGIDIVATRFAWPPAIERYLILALVIGFFVVLVLAWYHGERGAQHVGGTELLIIALLLAIGGGLIWRFGAGAKTPQPTVAKAASSAPASTTALPAPAASIPEKSVAVLPFVNENGQQDQQYFSDGLSEDLINALSQFQGLKVISRNSAFQFRNSKDSSAVIGRKLGVAHLLEGSVRKLGDEVRISATLVNAADGSIAWSAQYDKPYKDLFALQDAITKAVSGALKTKLLVNHAAAQSERPPSGNLAAWQAYQQGKFYDARHTQADARKALDAYAEAIRLDPHYAAAYARLSFDWTWLSSSYLAGVAQRNAYAEARVAADKALASAPNLALAHVARGYLLFTADFDWRGAQAEFQHAAQLAPHETWVLSNLAYMDAVLGRVHSAVESTRKELTTDPLHAEPYYLLSQYLCALNLVDAAQQAIATAIELQPEANNFQYQLAVVAILRGKSATALAAAQQESHPTWRRIALALATQIGPDHKAADAALQTLIDRDSEQDPYQIAEVYALRRDPDDMFKWLDRAWANRDPGLQGLLFDPIILRYRHDPRFAAFCKKVGLPTTTDAVAMK